jgi:GDP-L-fucose synthase
VNKNLLPTPIYVAGHRGMVGSAVVRRLLSLGYPQEALLTPTREELDLCDATATESWFCEQRPAVAVIAAARVGGIYANDTYPADFIADNLSIALNSVRAAFRAGVQRLLFLGSSCIYPKLAVQPMSEDALLQGPLEPTNEAYAVAKIAGLKLCQYFRKQHGVCFHSAMPTNLYGPGDNYHPQNSHVLPALIRRFHEAKLASAPEVVIWGTGTPRREFLHADDCAAGIVHLLGVANPPDWVNLGCGEDLTIAKLAKTVARVVGYEGALKFDPTKPDGTPRKLLDTRLMQTLGWKPEIDLESGLRSTYEAFCK